MGGYAGNGGTMKLIATIQLSGLQLTLESLSMQFPGFVLVNSLGVLKIYKQVK